MKAVYIIFIVILFVIAGFSSDTKYFFANIKWHGAESRDAKWIRSGRVGPGRTQFTHENITREKNSGLIKLTVPANKNEGSEIFSKNKIFLYGRFEARMKPSSVPGCVNAFFMKGERADDGEIDIEFLSKELGSGKGVVHFVLHPRKNLSREQCHKIIKLDFDPSEKFHTYGFSWSYDKIIFYVDGMESAAFMGSDGSPIMRTPGRIFMNAWTGRKDWGGGPPVQDAAMLIEWFKYTPFR